MKYWIIFLITFLFGYEGRVEPISTFNIKSFVNGKVLISNKSLEAKNIKNRLIVKIDDKVELSELKNIEIQMKILEEEIKNQVEIVKRKKELYEKYKNLASKPLEQKYMKFFDYINAKNQLLSLKNQLSSLRTQKVKIEDLIENKNIKFSGYLYSILVEKGEYVSIGTPIAIGYDLSQEKIEIFVPMDKINEIKGNIYINGKKSNFRISKVYKVPDIKYITSYKVELVGNGLKVGDLVKVDFSKK